MPDGAAGLAIFLAICSTGALWGQFRQLAVTDDGVQIYFLSELRPKGSAQPRGWTSIYRFSEGVTELIEDGPTSFLQSVGNPQISGGGQLVSIQRTFPCLGGSTCQLTNPTTYSTEILGESPRQSMPGRSQFSRNGRYQFQFASWSSFSSSTDIRKVRDRSNGTEWVIDGTPAARTQGITWDGKVLGFSKTDPGALRLFSRQSAIDIRAAGQAWWAIINDTGEWVVYSSNLGLRCLHLPSGRDVRVAESYRVDSTSISNDGSKLLYLTDERPPAATLMLYDLVSGKHRRLGNDEVVTEAVIAGFGKVVVAATLDNRLLRLNLVSGGVEVLADGGKPYQLNGSALVPGSLHWIIGQYFGSLSAIADFPLPDSLAGVRVLADDTPMRVLSVGPFEILFQAPFEWLPVSARPRLAVEIENRPLHPEDSPFQAPVNLINTSAASPLFLGGVAHEDFRSLVSLQDPARRGEILHVYATGLGEVVPVPPSGVRAPLDRQHVLKRPLDCRVQNATGPPVEVAFAGLAPGMVGIYQVSFRVPMDAHEFGFLLNCGFDERTRSGVSIHRVAP